MLKYCAIIGHVFKQLRQAVGNSQAVNDRVELNTTKLNVLAISIG
jgi:hypothetical protein